MALTQGSSISGVMAGAKNVPGVSKSELARQSQRAHAEIEREMQRRFEAGMDFLRRWGVSVDADNDNLEPRAEAS